MTTIVVAQMIAPRNGRRIAERREEQATMKRTDRTVRVMSGRSSFIQGLLREVLRIVPQKGATWCGNGRGKRLYRTTRRGLTEEPCQACSRVLLEPIHDCTPSSTGRALGGRARRGPATRCPHRPQRARGSQGSTGKPREFRRHQPRRLSKEERLDVAPGRLGRSRRVLGSRSASSNQARDRRTWYRSASATPYLLR